MNSSKIVKLTVLFLILISSNITHASEQYYGVKIGQMVTSIKGFFGEVEDSTNVGLNFGLPLGNNTAFEAEFTTTVIKGDAPAILAGLPGDFSINTLAGYYVYKSGLTSYLKLKAGLLYEDAEIADISGTDTGLSLGIGYGWKLESNNSIEIEFTMIESDINYFSVGYLF